MKTLKDHTLLYDNACPLCVSYTKGFIKTGMLAKNGRIPYHELADLNSNTLDKTRALNEIALVDTKNDKVYYGMDSLLRVIGNSFPLIEKIARLKLLYIFFKKLYSFVSYNRKVIISNPVPYESEKSCEPTFNYTYRLIYIGIALFFSVLILLNFFNVFTLDGYLSLVVTMLLPIPFQLLFLKNYDLRKKLNYTGHLITVQLIGALLLLPFLLLYNFGLIPVVSLMLIWLTVLLFMFYNHRLRVQNLVLPTGLSNSWLLYLIIPFVLIIKNLFL